MDAFIFILFFAFVAFVIFGSANKSSKSPTSKGLRPNGDYDIPKALQAKWNAETRQKSKSSTMPTERGRARLAAKGVQAVTQTVQGRRQSKEANARNREQAKEFAQTGDGAPRDKNGNRRDDWGRKGNMGPGFFGPLLGSVIAAGALAALFAVS
jgi:hypothetical protein